MPFITISREFGSHGSDVAAAVARTLGWTLVDNDVVDAVAQRLHVPASEVEAREERRTSLVERLASALTLSSPEVAPAAAQAGLPPSEEQMVEVTRRVIEEAVQRGPAVLVGRGAQAVLAARSDAIHVFVHAPFEALVARVMARDGLGRDEAARRVDERNRQRAAWVRRHFRREWRDPSHYHLSVNTAWLGIEGAAALIVSAARALPQIAGDGPAGASGAT